MQLQISAAKRFLLGSEDPIDSPSYNFIPRDEGINGINTLSAHDSSLESCLNPDWQRTTPVTLQSSSYQSNSCGYEISEFFDNGQFEPSSEEDTRLTLKQKQQFSIREISPEWAFCYEITKVHHEHFSFLRLNTNYAYVLLFLSQCRSSLLEISCVTRRIYAGQ